jgi:hypothetical protein
VTDSHPRARPGVLGRAANWLVAPREPADGEPAPAAPPVPTWLPPLGAAPPRAREGARLRERAERDPSAPHGDPWAGGRAPSSRPARARGIAASIPRVAVLGPAGDVPALAASAALALRARARASAAVVLLWPAEASGDGAPFVPPGVPPVAGWPAARLLARRLARRGTRVAARGRLVWIALDDAVDDPAAARAEAAAGDLPSALAIMRPRDGGVDAMLTERDLVLVAGEPEQPLGRLALDDFAVLGVAARVVAPPPAGAGRLAALGGLRTHVSLEAIA